MDTSLPTPRARISLSCSPAGAGRPNGDGRASRLPAGKTMLRAVSPGETEAGTYQYGGFPGTRTRRMRRSLSLGRCGQAA